MDWDALAERASGRYAEGADRLPSEPARREKQLVRMAMAAGAAGLARAMQHRREEAATWFRCSAERYRESWIGAPPESWGRPIGALKARLLAGDDEGAAADARWVLSLAPGGSGSAIGRYASALAHLVLRDDAAAAAAAHELAADETFPRAVADALLALARADASGYAEALRAVLASFESRDAFLEDVPVADTVLVLEALAEPRGIAVRPASRLLP